MKEATVFERASYKFLHKNIHFLAFINKPKDIRISVHSSSSQHRSWFLPEEEISGDHWFLLPHQIQPFIKSNRFDSQGFLESCHFSPSWCHHTTSSSSWGFLQQHPLGFFLQVFICHSSYCSQSKLSQSHMWPYGGWRTFRASWFKVKSQ